MVVVAQEVTGPAPDAGVLCLVAVVLGVRLLIVVGIALGRALGTTLKALQSGC